MNIVQRAANIMASPRAEWPRIEGERTTVGGLLMGYALPLAVLPFLVSVVAALLFAPDVGYGGGAAWAAVIVGGLLAVLLGLLLLFVMSLIADAVAQNFGGARNPVGALKLLVYSSTATWLAACFSFLPLMGTLLWLLAFGYAAYLIYLGSTEVMKVPRSSAAAYTAVVILLWILLSLVVAFVIGLILAVAVIGTALSTGAAGYLFN